MVGDAAATRARLIEAATAEFAAYGIAGARVDRIAAEAKSNKAQIYHYFGSKEKLFDAVFDALVITTVTQTPIDTTDLPEYAARLYDGYQKRPEVLRIATWHRLERAADDEPLATIVRSNRDKIAAIAAAQRAGELTDRFSAADLLGIVLSLSQLYSSAGPEYLLTVGRRSHANRRKVISDAVAAVLAAEPAD